MLVLKGTIKTLEAAQKHHPYGLRGVTTLGKYNNSAIKFRLKNYTKFMAYREPINRFAADYLMIKDSQVQRFHLKRAINYVDSQLKKGRLGPRRTEKDATITDFGLYVSRFGNDSQKLYQLNSQWYPQNLACHPCHFDYDYIIDMDSPDVAADAQYLLNIIGAPEWLQMLHSNPTQKDKSPILSQLPEDVYQRLLSVYYNDYEIFGHKRREWSSFKQVNKTVATL